MANILGQYEFHVYVRDLADITDGSVESKVRARRDYVDKHDPAGRQKYLYLGEMGDKVGITNNRLDQQNRVRSYPYGVEIADMAIQAVRGGVGGLNLWDLDDAMHYNVRRQAKTWGFFNSVGGQTIQGTSYPASDTNLRPWYYPMSTMTRLFPQGSTTVYTGPSGVDELRAATAVIPRRTGADVSVALVNEQASDKSVLLRILGVAGRVNLLEYRYSPAIRPVDSTMSTVDLRGGQVVIVPADSALFLTTLGTNATSTAT